MNYYSENIRSSERQLGEQRFAHKVGRLLNEGTATLSADRLERLAAARKAALQAHVPSPAAAIVWGRRTALAAHGSRAFTGGGDFSHGLFGRAGLCAASVLLVGTCLIGLFKAEQHRRIEEFAATDAEVLSDKLPISAYADQGFNAFLQQNHK